MTKQKAQLAVSGNGGVVPNGRFVVRTKRGKELAAFGDHIDARRWLKKHAEAWDVMTRDDKVVLSTKGSGRKRENEDE